MLQPARGGLSFIAYLAWVAVLSIAVVVGWGVYANWSRDRDGDGAADGLTFHVWDPTWWQLSRARAAPVVANARQQVERLADHIWGEQGALQQAQDDAQAAPALPPVQPFGMAERPASPAAVDATPGGPRPDSVSAPIGPPSQDAVESGFVSPSSHSPSSHSPSPQSPPSRSPRTQRLEERIAYAHDHFQRGLDHYRQAQPGADGSWGEPQLLAAEVAANAFGLAQRLLNEGDVINAYALLPDHRIEVLDFAQRMEQHIKVLAESLRQVIAPPSSP